MRNSTLRKLATLFVVLAGLSSAATVATAAGSAVTGDVTYIVKPGH